MAFRDRTEAGRALARALGEYGGRGDVIVLALPRGGLPVGLEVARALGARLDVYVVRKLGVPGHEELAMGAVASGGVRVLNAEVVETLGISDAELDRAAVAQEREVERRDRRYRGDRPPLELAGRVVILVDDGLATGSTMRAAVAAVRRLGPARIVVAVPVAPPESCAALRQEADEVVCVEMPDPFFAVGAWYDEFPQLEDDEVRLILQRAADERAAAPPPPPA